LLAGIYTIQGFLSEELFNAASNKSSCKVASDLFVITFLVLYAFFAAARFFVVVLAAEPLTTKHPVANTIAKITLNNLFINLHPFLIWYIAHGTILCPG
jgi:hypothetical protein